MLTVLVFLHLSMLGKILFRKQGCVRLFSLGYTPQMRNCKNSHSIPSQILEYELEKNCQCLKTLSNGGDVCV